MKYTISASVWCLAFLSQISNFWGMCIVERQQHKIADEPHGFAQELEEPQQTVTSFATILKTVTKTHTFTDHTYVSSYYKPETLDETNNLLTPLSSLDKTDIQYTTSTIIIPSIPNTSRLKLQRRSASLTPITIPTTTYPSISLLGTTVPAGATIAITGSTLTTTFTLPSVVSALQGTGIILNAQTLMEGGEATVEGTTYSLPSGSSTPVIVPASTSTRGGADGVKQSGSGGQRVVGSRWGLWVAASSVAVVLGSL